MRRKDLPSKAQAQFIAHFWGAAKTYQVGGFDNSTIIVCLERGWLIPNGKNGTYPSGSNWTGHAISNLGLIALENYLMNQRLGNADAARVGG